jgi:hypothetical protein
MCTLEDYEYYMANKKAWELETWDDDKAKDNLQLADTQGQIKNGEFHEDSVLEKLARQEFFPTAKINLAPTTEKIKINPMSHVYGEVYYDNVKEPQHNKIFPDMQVIDIIKKTLTDEEFKGYCKGNILKYRLRDKENINEDFEKSREYKMYLQAIEAS